MENKQETCELHYNTAREKLRMPEYGRNVQKMVDYVKTVEDQEKRNEQAKAVVNVMEIINPQVHLQENYEQKLWDQLHIISGFGLDIDSPYPVPAMDTISERPREVPIETKPIRYTHYGRNIESIVDLIAEQEDGETKTAMIRSLAIYMRQQYLIWNKDMVADQTIFDDIVKLSEGRIHIPEGLQLTRISSDASFSRPGQNTGKHQGNNRRGGQRQKKQRK